MDSSGIRGAERRGRQFEFVAEIIRHCSASIPALAVTASAAVLLIRQESVRQIVCAPGPLASRADAIAPAGADPVRAVEMTHGDVPFALGNWPRSRRTCTRKGAATVP